MSGSNTSVAQRAPSFAELQGLLDALPTPIILADRDGSITYRNASAQQRLPHGATLQETFRRVTMPELFRGWPAELRGLAAGESTRSFTVLLPGAADDEGPAEYALELSPVPSDPEAVVVRLAPAVQPGADAGPHAVAARLTALGKMAARVAHELNNPLDGILRYINLSLRLANEAPQPKLKTYLNESRTGLLRMIEIIRDLLEYSRATAGAFDDADVNAIVEQAVRDNTEGADANGVIVAVDFQTAQMPAIRGGQLYQVCCNLIRNAVDAMPDGGRLSITTGLVEEHVVIRIADSGVGLPDPPDKVFEAFYTTKDPGKGTGLGLAICKEFVEDLGGTILAAGVEPHGAAFTVRIPVASCLAPAPSRRLTAPCPERNRADGEQP